jgi:hypothetical protein
MPGNKKRKSKSLLYTNAKQLQQKNVQTSLMHPKLQHKRRV